MKRTIEVVTALAVVILVCVTVLVACVSHVFKLEDGKNAYDIAVENGFEGTEADWLASLSGKSGVSIENVSISYEVSEDGDIYTVYTIHYSDGTKSEIKTIVPESAATASELSEALFAGGNVMLATDINPTENIVMNGGSLDGNGKVIDAALVTTGYTNCVITTTGGVVENVSILGARRGLGTGSSGTYELASDLVVSDVVIDGGVYAINVGGGSGHKLIVSNSELYGWSSYSGLSQASFVGCVFGQGNTDYAYVRAYDNTSFEGCVFEDGFKLGVNSDGLEDGELLRIELKNCYYGDVLITADNFASLLTVAGDEDTVALRSCEVLVNGVIVGADAFN